MPREDSFIDGWFKETEAEDHRRLLQRGWGKVWLENLTLGRQPPENRQAIRKGRDHDADTHMKSMWPTCSKRLDRPRWRILPLRGS